MTETKNTGAAQTAQTKELAAQAAHSEASAAQTAQTQEPAAMIARMKELTSLLTEASKAYYAEDREIISNLEYDRLYAELEQLERESGIVLAGSPTQHVGYEAVDELPKEEHEKPMLSLDKTKDREVLRTFIGGHTTLLSWKLDGLTVVLEYRGGTLYKALTRGNGRIGEVITANARTFRNLPLKIAYDGDLVLRGEAVISYEDFEKINAQLGPGDVHYKNPRNLCSGSVRQLSSEVTARRHVRFFAFTLVRAEGVDFQNSHEKQLRWLESQGFEAVERRLVTAETLDEAMAYFEEKVGQYEIPSDGLVALYDDIAYGESLGTTAKFPRNSFAFKWQDEEAETVLRDVEWSASRTGLINPVAVFDPVELEGTTVTRASVHNVSIVRELKLGLGDRLKVYKANMIIPQIAENLTRSGTLEIPEYCPVCGAKTVIRQELDTETLVCENAACSAKKIKSFTLLVSRDALNIDGLSEMTLEKLIARGLLHHYADIFHLREHRAEIMEMDGFGERSCVKMEESIERARETTLARLLYGLGIPGIGAANARVIARAFGNDVERARSADEEALLQVDGVGSVLAKAYTAWMRDEDNRRETDALLAELTLEAPAGDESGAAAELFAGKVFVITGSVEHFKNRSELKAFIEARGGKVTGSVSANTDCLINNDAASGSAKNRKARELGVPVVTEEEFLALAGGGAPEG